LDKVKLRTWQLFRCIQWLPGPPVTVTQIEHEHKPKWSLVIHSAWRQPEGLRILTDGSFTRLTSARSRGIGFHRFVSLGRNQDKSIIWRVGLGSMILQVSWYSAFYDSNPLKISTFRKVQEHWKMLIHKNINNQADTNGSNTQIYLVMPSSLSISRMSIDQRSYSDLANIVCVAKMFYLTTSEFRRHLVGIQVAMAGESVINWSFFMSIE